MVLMLQNFLEEDHLKLVYKSLTTKLDEDNFRINLPYSQYAKTKIE